MKSGQEFRDYLQGRGNTVPNDFRNILRAEKLDNFIKDVLPMPNPRGCSRCIFCFEMDLEFGTGLLRDPELGVDGKSQRFSNRCIFFMEKNLEFRAGLLRDPELGVDVKCWRFCNRCIFLF